MGERAKLIALLIHPHRPWQAGRSFFSATNHESGFRIVGWLKIAAQKLRVPAPTALDEGPKFKTRVTHPDHPGANGMFFLISTELDTPLLSTLFILNLFV